MFDLFLAQIFIILLLLISNLRIFFLHKSKTDCIAVIPVLTLAGSVINILIWGAEPANILLCCISFFTFFINIHSLQRLISNVYIDTYSLCFFVLSFLLLAVTAVFTAGLFIVRPVQTVPAKYNITKTKSLLTGSVTQGFRIKSSSFSNESFNGTLYIYECDDPSKMKDEILIFTPGITAAVENYEPYLILMAQKGYRVAAADFYPADLRFYNNLADTRLLRKPYSVYLSLKKNGYFDQMSSDLTLFNQKCYESLSALVINSYGENTKIFYIIDGLSYDTISQAFEKFKTNTHGVFPLNRISEYKTSGYGFIEQTDPLLGFLLNIKRDSTLFIPRYCANKTEQAIIRQKALN